MFDYFINGALFQLTLFFFSFSLSLFLSLSLCMCSLFNRYEIEFEIYSTSNLPPNPCIVGAWDDVTSSSDSPSRRRLALCFSNGNHYDAVLDERSFDCLSMCQQLAFSLVDRALGDAPSLDFSAHAFSNTWLARWEQERIAQEAQSLQFAHDLVRPSSSSSSSAAAGLPNLNDWVTVSGSRHGKPRGGNGVHTLPPIDPQAEAEQQQLAILRALEQEEARRRQISSAISSNDATLFPTLKTKRPIMPSSPTTVSSQGSSPTIDTPADSSIHAAITPTVQSTTPAEAPLPDTPSDANTPEAAATVGALSSPAKPSWSHFAAVSPSSQPPSSTPTPPPPPCPTQSPAATAVDSSSPAVASPPPSSNPQTPAADSSPATSDPTVPPADPELHKPFTWARLAQAPPKPRPAPTPAPAPLPAPAPTPASHSSHPPRRDHGERRGRGGASSRGSGGHERDQGSRRGGQQVSRGGQQASRGGRGESAPRR